MKHIKRSLRVFGLLSVAALLTLPGVMLWAKRAAAAPELVQTKYNSIGAGTAVNATLPSTTTEGNLMVIYAVWSNTGEVSLTDTRGNTYEKALPTNTTWANNYSAQVFYAKNIHGGATTVTATFADQVSFGVLYTHEYSGLDKLNPLDGSNAAAGMGVSLDSGDVTTTREGDLIFGGTASEAAIEAAGSGFTTRLTDEGNLTEDKVAESAGTYNVTATHGGGKWVAQVAAFKPADVTAPSVPAGLNATPASTSAVNLTWTASTDNVGVAGYKVYRGGNYVGSTTNTNYQDTGLTAGTSYSYSVSAYDETGNESAPSETVSGVTLPPPLADLAATATGSREVTLTWSAPTSIEGVTGYRVSRGSTAIGTPTATGWIDTGLNAQTDYTYTVAALDATGAVLAEAAVSVTTPAAEPTTACSLPNYPNEGCTGVPASVTLTDFLTSSCTPGPLPGEGCNITAVDGTTCTRYREAENGPISDPICAFTTPSHTVDGMNIEGCAEISAPGVVIRNSKISCAGSWVVMSGFGYSGTGVLLEDVDISCMPDGATQAAGKTGVTYRNYTLRRANVHSCENATSILENVTIQDSYLHDLYVEIGVTHSDGVQIFQGSNNITIKHNAIDGANGNAAITSPKVADGLASNVLIQNNLLAGGGYTLYCQQDGAGNNYRVIDNHFGSSAYAPWLGCQDEAQVTGNSGNGLNNGGGESGGGNEGGNVRLEDLQRVPWEGGPSYYSNFPSATAWNNPNFFPIGVWFEQVDNQAQVELDKSMGLNTYFELGGSSDLALVRNNGMYAVQKLATTNMGSETVGDLLTDEADMTYGAGSDQWSGTEGWNTCSPIQDMHGKCGYTVMETFLSRSVPGNGRFKYANYGKGVLMWQTTEQAAPFVNNYTSATSADMYFYTDPYPCSPDHAAPFGAIEPENCRKAANYGLVIDKMRDLDALDGQRQPIYAFVEDGHPFGEAEAPTITGDQLAGAVFSSLIHEARGVIYFNHSFGGCLSHHVLRESCGDAIRPKVTETNARITELAPVLNTQSYKYTFNNQLETMLKSHDGSYYIFAMQKRTHNSGTYAFTLPQGMQGSTVQVLYENRTLPITDGSFTDSFAAEYGYHIYKITP